MVIMLMHGYAEITMQSRISKKIVIDLSIAKLEVATEEIIEVVKLVVINLTWYNALPLVN